MPLAFGVMSVVVAYLLGRQLGRVAAVAAGMAAALAPSALRNHNLKQYSADAFVTLLLLWLTARLEAGWSPRRLVTSAWPASRRCSSATSPCSFGRGAGRAGRAGTGGASLGAAPLARRLGLAVAAVEAAAYLAFAASGNNLSLTGGGPTT